MMLISFILITFVGQLEILAYEIDEELLPFEFQEKSLPMSDELANDAGRSKYTNISSSVKIRYNQTIERSIRAS